MRTAGLSPAKERPVSLKVGGCMSTNAFAWSVGKPSSIRNFSLTNGTTYVFVILSSERGGSCNRM